MITTILGTNSYASAQKIAELSSAFAEQFGDSIERFDMNDSDDVDAVIDAVRSLSFLEPQKMVLVRNFATSKPFLDRIEQILTAVADTTHLVLSDTAVDKRSSAYKLLRSHTTLYEFTEPSEGELLRWAQEQCREQGLQLDGSLVRLLVQRVGPNQQRLSQEILKLIHAPQPVTADLLCELVEETPQSLVFALLEALFRRDLKKTMALYKEQRLKGEEPQKILAMIVWQLENLAQFVFSPAPSADALIAGGMNPFNARKTAELAKHISKTQLARFIDELLQADSLSKKSADSESALMVYFSVVAKA